MLTHPINYFAPGGVEEACALLNEHEHSAVLAGGTVLVPDMTSGKARPSTVVDLRRAGMDAVTVDGAEVTVGATTTYSTLSSHDMLRATQPLLGMVADQITGGLQIKNRGTAGGSVCYANPASDIPMCLVALGASVVLRTTNGSRELPVSDFVVDAFRTDRDPNELLSEIRIPRTNRRRPQWAFVKLKFGESSWPIVSAACCLELDEDRKLVAGSLTVGGASRTPAVTDLQSLSGQRVTDQVARDAGELLAEAIDEPWADELAPADYRQRVVAVVARRAVQTAASMQHQ